jgi:hypothetical protein
MALVNMEVIQYLNSDKLFYAFTMLTMNFGSKYVLQDVTELQQKALASNVAKKIILFSMIFIATRDIIKSICITFVITVFMQYFLNEKSSLCIIPNLVEKPLINEYIKLFKSIK